MYGKVRTLHYGHSHIFKMKFKSRKDMSVKRNISLKHFYVIIIDEVN